MIHLESCIRRSIAVKDMREELNEKYPCLCEYCEGWGGVIYRDTNIKVIEGGLKATETGDEENEIEEDTETDTMESTSSGVWSLPAEKGEPETEEEVYWDSVVDCPVCVGNGTCPRCGFPYCSEEDSNCDSCGYILGETRGLPYPHQCLCISLPTNQYIRDKRRQELEKSKENKKRKSK